ncbi:unnamed protein product [Linum trigynum]
MARQRRRAARSRQRGVVAGRKRDHQQQARARGAGDVTVDRQRHQEQAMRAQDWASSLFCATAVGVVRRDEREICRGVEVGVRVVRLGRFGGWGLMGRFGGWGVIFGGEGQVVLEGLERGSVRRLADHLPNFSDNRMPSITNGF